MTTKHEANSEVPFQGCYETLILTEEKEKGEDIIRDSWWLMMVGGVSGFLLKGSDGYL